VTLEGKTFEIRAKMEQKSGFSGHGDEKDLLKYLQSTNLKRDAHILVIHGDTKSSSIALKHTLERKDFPQIVHVPDLEEKFIPSILINNLCLEKIEKSHSVMTSKFYKPKIPS
jgi:RNA-metabolizing metallo-beta-lactamase